MNDIVKWRRWFHAHPELAFSEFETSKFIKEFLDEWGVGRKDWGDTGITAEIGKGDTIIAFRTDMDALPIEEENDVPYRSLYPGRMHACGHDGHMAILLGVIRALKAREKELSGKVVFIFQPAEEVGKGAKFMVENGVMEYYGIEKVIGFHLFSSLPTGTIGSKPGIIMAEGDKFVIDISAKGAHGATPWLSHDIIATTATLIQSVFSNLLRRISPLSEQVVLSIGKIHAGSVFNVIPQTAKIEGTIRSLSHKKRNEVVKKLKEITKSIVEALDGNVDVNIEQVFPPVINDEELYHVLEDVVSQSEFKFLKVKPTTVSEDFSFFSQDVPGLYFFIGMRNEEKGIVYPHHHPRFDIDEEVLEPATGLLVSLTNRIL